MVYDLNLNEAMKELQEAEEILYYYRANIQELQKLEKIAIRVKDDEKVEVLKRIVNMKSFLREQSVRIAGHMTNGRKHIAIAKVDGILEVE